MLEFASNVPITVLETAKFESICEGLAMNRCLDRGSQQHFYVDDAECQKTEGLVAR
jgi:hypothetical protein